MFHWGRPFMPHSIARIAAAVAATVLTVSAARADSPEKLGTVSFANSCSTAVQPQLQRSVALLHSFWWGEGDKAFREVLVQDPGCAIAGWGIAALAIGNPYATGATPEDAKRAQEAIAQARAIGAYYDRFAERPHSARLRSMADAFEALAKQYPDDDETQIFSAIYLVSTQPPADKTFARAMQGAAILEAQFPKHRDHPGVAHYLIHAYDYPPIADKGLAAAMCYADIAPSAPHALHMPSHIFTRVGLWQESATTNRRASAAATGEAERSDRLHALDYLVYASLQLARDKDAATALDEARQVTSAAATEDKSEKHPVSPGRLIPARELLGDMLLESGRPAEALTEYEASQIRDPKRFRGYWGAGQAAAQAGNKDKARFYFTHLVELAGSSDPRPELAKAREYLAMK